MNQQSSDTAKESDAKKSDVHDRIKQDIIEGRWKPDTKLSISDMRSDYDVSLSPLREALSRLAATGFIAAEKQRGFRVAKVSQNDLADLNKVRTQLECWALRDAIKKGDKVWEGEIVAAYHRLARTPYENEDDPDRVSAEWNRCHKEFHYALVGACDSIWLMRFRDILFDEMERYRNLSIEYTSIRREIGNNGAKGDAANFEDEHKMLVDAVLEGNQKKACALIVAHFGKTFEIVSHILGNEQH